MNPRQKSMLHEMKQACTKKQKGRARGGNRKMNQAKFTQAILRAQNLQLKLPSYALST